MLVSRNTVTPRSRVKSWQRMWSRQPAAVTTKTTSAMTRARAAVSPQVGTTSERPGTCGSCFSTSASAQLPDRTGARTYPCWNLLYGMLKQRPPRQAPQPTSPRSTRSQHPPQAEIKKSRPVHRTSPINHPRLKTQPPSTLQPATRTATTSQKMSTMYTAISARVLARRPRRAVSLATTPKTDSRTRTTTRWCLYPSGPLR
ncbi:hypothetical protein B0T21DRAFT_93519 [Apiosordaria backusii]|uniref:Uncharacterized protein n=1 Tax=Apiosordaria backusii TaxID=314023 RepID=A0AA40ESQ4_9PEZI|nr:hypothetical protein B0T21DRAFT_93519 [Apiosordaria backusii]